MMAKGGKSQKANKQQGRPKGVGPTVLIQHIRTIAPTTPLTHSTCIANTQTLSAIDHLRCPICLEILSQPVELPCRAVLCAACIIRWLTFSACTRCPCCYSETPLDPAQINPASSLILELLQDIIVSCSLCKVEMKAGTLDQHQCSPQLKTVAREELQTTASVIQQLLSQSPENVVELPTKGTVSQTHTHTHTHTHARTHTLSLSWNLLTH